MSVRTPLHYLRSKQVTSMDEKVNISVDLTAQVVSMILEQARYQARNMVVTTDHIRAAAELVFLAIDLIRERNA